MYLIRLKALFFRSSISRKYYFILYTYLFSFSFPLILNNKIFPNIIFLTLQFCLSFYQLVKVFLQEFNKTKLFINFFFY